MMFEAGVLHRGPEVGLVGEAIDLIGKKVPGVMIVPVAIRYDMSLHERPEAFLIVGDPIAPGGSARDLATEAIREMLRAWEPDDADYRVLAPGTPDVNERWDRVRRR